MYSIDNAVLHITTYCSHKCPFCYAINDNILRKHQSYDILKRIIIELNIAKVKELLFVGGDPATHPYVITLGKMAKALGIRTAILSNTLDFSNSTYEDVINAFDVIETTIHHSDFHKHDSFCLKEGAYDNVVNKLKYYQSKDTHLGIAINITSDTYLILYEIVNSIIENNNINIDHVVFQRIAPVGRAFEKDKWNITIDTINIIFEQIARIDSVYKIDICLEDAFPLCCVPNKYHKYLHSCMWGYNSCSLDMDGNISKCCTDPRYILGNILEIPLLELWNSSQELLHKRKGNDVPRKCIECNQYTICKGGCALASEVNNCNGDPLISSV